MPKLSFRIQADYEKVQRLREEISKLKQELKGVNAIQNPTDFNNLNVKLRQTSEELGNVTSKIAQTSATMETNFKQKIFAASQSVNEFTEKIIAQKAVVKDVEADVRKLGDIYRSALKNNPLSANGKHAEYIAAKKALEEEKSALFGLTQQQAEARLSVKKLRDEYALFKKEGGGTADTLDLLTSKMKGITTAVVGGLGLKSLVSNIISVRREFEGMEASLKVLLGGNQERLNKIMGQIKEYALASPLNTKDMVGAVQMMTSFGIEAEKSIGYLKAIGDISMGNTGKFNSLALAFSQMSSAGKLMGQDLLQMVNAGFNPLEEISRKTGKSIGELKNEMSKGVITSKMVQDAFISVTSEGGKFFGMSQEGAKTLNGQISMLQESFDNMFNEIGAKGQPVVMSAIQLGTKLVENYERVGRVLLGLVETYGAYRVGLAIATFAQNGHTLAMTIARTRILLAQKAQALLNATMLANPYVLVTTALVGLVSAMWAFGDSSTEAEKAQKQFNERQEEAAKKEQEHKQKIDSLLESSRDIALSDLERGRSLSELRKEYKNIFEKYDVETIKLANILELKREIAEEDARRTEKEKNKDFEAAKKELSDYEIKLSAKHVNGGKIFEQEKKKLERLQANVDQFLIDRGKGISEQFISGLKDLDISKFDSYILKLEDRIKGQGKNGNVKLRLPVDVKGALSDEAIYSVEEIKTLIDTVKSIKGKRIDDEKNKTTYEQDIKEAKKKWEDAKKKLYAIEKDKDKFTSEQYKKAKNDADAAEKKYKDLGGTTDEKLLKEKYNILIDKQKLEQRRKFQDIENQLEQSEIDKLTDETEKTIRQRELSNKKEIQAIKRQKEDYIKAVIQSKKDKFDAEEELKAKKYHNYKKRTFDASSVSVDASKFDEIISNTEERQKYNVYKAEADAMRNFLKEYGTFQQQKLSITKEYAEKIKKAQSEGEKRTLEKQRDAALLGVDVKAAKQNIDWQSVFGDLGSMLRDQIQPTIDNLKKITQSDEFRNSSVEDQQRIYDILSQLERQSGTLGKDLFKDVARDLELYRNSLNAYNAAQEREIKAAEKLAEAQEKLRVAQENGGDVFAAQEAVSKAQEAFNQASESVETLGEKASENAETLRTSSEKAKGALDGLAGGLNSLRSGSLAQALDGIKDIGKSLGGKIGDAIADIDPTGIVSSVFSILDILKDGFSGIFVSLQDVLYGAIEGILNDVFSGDIIVKPIKNAMKHIGNILDTITFGGFNSWTSSSNAKEVAETTERLTSSNERLKNSVDSLKDEMSKSGGWRAIDTAKQAKEDQQTINRQTMEILRTQMGYHSSHHSNAYYWGLNQRDYSELNKTLSNYAKKNNKEASRVGSLTDIYKLTPEEMDYIRTYNVEMWKKMLDQGKYDKSEYWEKYADLTGKMEEITSALKETLTQMSFDSLRSSFVDSLMDMNKSAKDFANDFQEYMMRAILNAKISDLLDKDIKEFYDLWASYSESGNKVDGWEQKELHKRWNEITQRGLKIRDEVAEFTGYNKSFSQESTKKGFEAMTQDQAGELNGRFTALQVAGEEIKLQSVSQSQMLSILTMKMDDILSVNTETKNISDDIRNIIANSYLELVQISENTGAIVKPIQQMQKDIAEVKKNTSKL